MVLLASSFIQELLQWTTPITSHQANLVLMMPHHSTPCYALQGGSSLLCVLRHSLSAAIIQLGNKTAQGGSSEAMHVHGNRAPPALYYYC